LGIDRSGILEIAYGVGDPEIHMYAYDGMMEAEISKADLLLR